MGFTQKVSSCFSLAASLPEVSETGSLQLFRYPVYIPGKADGALIVPEDLTVQDVEAIKLAVSQIELYAKMRSEKAKAE